ncbi:MAG: low molecular weight phosphotyrosine protein phosphatase [Flavobacteriales bacterium]|nr:low molecular weight phosphotyrosine protein phosphatase [Flavobacteriales bacterium]
MKTRVLMVCLGNICRSPIAEGILRDRVQKEGLDIETDSAGTSSFHVGEKPDSRMRAAALKNGIDISDLRARQFVVSDFDEFDIIYAMDRSNYNNIMALARNAEDEAKVRMILNESNPGMNYEVPDPYYGGDQGFQDVIDMLNDAMDVVIQKING